MFTRPLRFAGRTLLLNFATSAPGSIRVEIQDVSGKPVPGYGARPVLAKPSATRSSGRFLEERFRDLARLAGKPVRLRFVMKDAELYALRFR